MHGFPSTAFLAVVARQGQGMLLADPGALAAAEVLQEVHREGLAELEGVGALVFLAMTGA